MRFPTASGPPLARDADRKARVVWPFSVPLASRRGKTVVDEERQPPGRKTARRTGQSLRQARQQAASPEGRCARTRSRLRSPRCHRPKGKGASLRSSRRSNPSTPVEGASPARFRQNRCRSFLNRSALETFHLIDSGNGLKLEQYGGVPHRSPRSAGALAPKLGGARVGQCRCDLYRRYG